MISEESESLEDAIESVIRRVLTNEVSTFFPAVIDSIIPSKINPNTMLVNLTSNFSIIDDLTKAFIPQKLFDVPLLYPRTNNFMLRPPLDASIIGTSVGVLVSNNFLADWQKTGTISPPTENRKFNINDCVAIIGLYPELTSWITPSIPNTAELKVLTGTKLEIGNNVTDIVKVIKNILEILILPDNGGYTYTGVTASNGKDLTALLTELTVLANPG